MKFRIKVRTAKRPEGWWEEYEKNVDDAQAWAERTVAWFNDTRTQHEEERELVEVEVLDADAIKDHAWEKQNAVSLPNGNDEYKCERCGVVAERMAFTDIYKRRSKYRAKVYERCDTALAHLKKRGKI